MAGMALRRLVPVRKKYGEDGSQDDGSVIQQPQLADTVKQEFIRSQDVDRRNGDQLRRPVGHRQPGAIYSAC